MNFQLSDYQRQIQQLASDLAKRDFKARAYTWEERGEYPWEYLRLLSAHGLTGLAIPEEDGGQGGKLMDAVLAIEAIAAVDPAAGDAVQATNFGAIQQIARFGSPYLKDRYLHPLLRGEGMITIGMTEPGAGSAVTQLATRAHIDGDHVVINGQKTFNSNGPFATAYVVWVKFGESSRSAGAVVVDRTAPGLQVFPHKFLSGELYADLFLEDCRVPVENILMKEDGFRKMMSVFNIERLGNASRSLALGQAAFTIALEWAKEREQFGQRLCDFQGIQWKFAEMSLKLESARLLLYRAASNADAGVPSPQETALAKLACNRAGFEVANEALQVLGGYGYAAESALSYIFRRTRGWMIAGGTQEQLLNRIASGVFGENLKQPAR